MEGEFIVYYEIPPLRAIMSIKVDAESEDEAIEIVMEQLNVSIRVKGVQKVNLNVW